MKTLTRLLCAGLVLSCGAALAEPRRPERDPVAESLFPPELIVQNQISVGLADAQKAFIRAEIGKAQSRFTDLQWQLQDAVESLVSLLKREPVEEAQVLAQLDKVLDFEREIKRGQIGLMVRIKNKLTAEQQGRLRELRGKVGGE